MTCTLRTFTSKLNHLVAASRKERRKLLKQTIVRGKEKHKLSPRQNRFVFIAYFVISREYSCQFGQVLTENPKNSETITVFDANLDGPVGKAVRNYSVCMGIQWQIAFSKNFTRLVNQNIKILGRRLYSPSMEDVAWLEDAQLICLLISIHLSVNLAG